MSRTQAAAISLNPVPVLEALPRPKPPDELCDEAKREWLKIVGDLPADWFRNENLPLLVEYVTMIVRSKRVRQLIDDMEAGEKFVVENYQSLIRTSLSVTRSMAAVAAALRLSQQAQYEPSTEKKTRAAADPWSK